MHEPKLQLLASPLTIIMETDGKDIESQIEEIRTELIERDRRPISVHWNFLVNRKKWEKSDPRRLAAVKALLWYWLAPSTIIIATGGMAAYFSLYFISRQTSAVEETNRHFVTQNKYISDQYSTSRRTELLNFLYTEEENNNGILTVKANSRIRSDALVEFAPLEFQRILNDYKLNLNEFDEYDFKIIDIDTDSIKPIVISFYRSKLSDVSIRGISLTGLTGKQGDQTFKSVLTFQEADLKRGEFIRSDFSNNIFRIAKMDSSNIRGSKFLRCSFIRTRFTNSTLIDVDFSFSSMILANFNDIVCNSCKFDSANLRQAKFRRAGLSGSSFSNANLLVADFNGAYLDSVDFTNTNVTKRQLSKAKTLYGAMIEPDLKYELEKDYPELFLKPEEIVLPPEPE